MNSTFLSFVVFLSCLGAAATDYPYSTDFTSSDRFFSKEDIDTSMMQDVIGQWYDLSRNSDAPLSMAISKIGDATFLTLPSSVQDGKTVIVPLKRDVLRSGKRIPCWLTYLPKDSKMSNETLKSFGKSGRFGWIEATEDKIIVISTSLRRTECANWFSTKCPLFDAIHITQGRSEFWELLSKHKMEIAQDVGNIEWTLTRSHQEDGEVGTPEPPPPTEHE